MKIKKTIYVDMDGVVADFETGFNKLYDVQLNDLTKDELRVYKAKFAEDGFYENLPPFKNAYDLIVALKAKYERVEILTAVGVFDTEEVIRQKRVWCVKNLPLVRFKWVVKAATKDKYAAPDALLIDDRAKSYDPFKAAGGQICIHKTIEETFLALM
jgi:5'-nucleotidase